MHASGRTPSALGTFVGLAALAVVGPTVLAGNPDAALGVYGVVLGNVDVSSTLVWFVRHLADLDLYVGLVPFVATLILVARSLAGRGDRVTDEFVALAGWTIVCLVGNRRRVRIEAAGGERGLHRDGSAAPRAEHVRGRPAPC